MKKRYKVSSVLKKPEEKDKARYDEKLHKGLARSLTHICAEVSFGPNAAKTYEGTHIFRNLDVLKGLKDEGVPVHIVHGEDDPMCDVAVARALGAGIGLTEGEELLVSPNTGHGGGEPENFKNLVKAHNEMASILRPEFDSLDKTDLHN